MTPPQPKSGTATTVDAEEARIAAFLAKEPDFFDRHPTLLAQLRLPHARGDLSTVSLVERQVEVLRERTRDGEAKLRALIDNGRANDALAARMQRLAVRLISARDRIARLVALEASLSEDFAVREFTLILTGSVPAGAPGYVRHVPIDDAGLQSLDSLFATAKPRCGRVRDAQRDFLFPKSSLTIGSVALVPLALAGTPALLAIGSSDVDHFNPTMSTDFLARIGELVAAALDGPETGGA